MQKRLRVALATAAAAALTGGLLTAAALTGSAVAEGALAEADFNGDGVRDLAVSAPSAYVSGKAAAGQVVVHYGTANGGAKAGISGTKSAVYSQNSAGIPGGAEAGDYWGESTSVADFNGDSYTDLAVGAPFEDVDGDADGGLVQILWGSANGLSGGTTLPDPRTGQHDWFGRTVEAADYNGDDKADLAVGASGATIDVFSGGFGKTQGTYAGKYGVVPPIHSGKPDGGPRNLHAGDVNGDDIADLVVDGFENTAEGWDTNYYLPGSASGLTTTGQKKLPSGVITDIGDVNEDDYGDIVTGLSWDDEEFPDAALGGKVNITYGSATGPTGSTSIDQDTVGVPGSSEKGDGFGAELHLGDVNGDGHLDLAVSAASENLGGVSNTGAVTVLFGAVDGSGFGGAGGQFLSQNTAGVPNSNEKNDYFGSDVHIADLNGDGTDDLTVGAVGENGGNGAVYALRSNGSQLAETGATSMYVSSVGISASGSPEYGYNFAG